MSKQPNTPRDVLIATTTFMVVFVVIFGGMVLILREVMR